jgi:hypothetical protein
MDRLGKQTLGTLSPISDGGQGVVFKVTGMQSRARGKPVSLVYKEYKEQTRRSLNVPALESLAAFRDSVAGSTQERLVQRTALPLHLVTGSGGVTGFTMVEVPRQFLHTMHFQRGPGETLGEVQHLLQSESLLAARQIKLTDRLRFEFLLDVAETLDLFHRHDLIVGDLSAKNLLFRLSGKVRCFFLDCDSMLLRGQAAVPLAETPEWEVPAGEPPGTRQGDLYKFGLLVVRLFAGDQRIRDATPARLATAQLSRLAQSSLAKNPAVRPSAADWLTPLAKAIGHASTRPPQAAPHQRPSQTASTYGFTPPSPGLISPPQLVPTVRPSPVIRPAPLVQPAPAATRPRRMQGRWAVAGAGLLAALVAGVIFVLSHGGFLGSGAAADATAATHQQAVAVNHLLRSSTASRSLLAGAFAAAKSCSHLAGDVSKMQRAAHRRSSEVRTAAKLQTGALANGASLQSALQSALGHSLRTDQDYLRWARHLRRSGCSAPAPLTRDYRRGVTESRRATSAKRKFLKLWNPIADQEGFAHRSQGRI